MRIQNIQNNRMDQYAQVERMREQRLREQEKAQEQPLEGRDGVSGLSSKRREGMEDERGSSRADIHTPPKADKDAYIPGTKAQQPEADAPKEEKEAKEADKSNKSDQKKSEKCTGNTDKVDREIEKLKKKKKELEQKVAAEKDPQKAERLKSQLAQVERELKQKDNDGYRKSHTVFT
ncbi:hypothetical protein D3Z50_00925 [Clostridiaceae bacterium]|jgi:hypothetical protein|nr:hypothetical protein [Clostridium sp.]NBI69647.1 hypothetical protein [Clostridiaceae bacterium]